MLNEHTQWQMVFPLTSIIINKISILNLSLSIGDNEQYGINRPNNPYQLQFTFCSRSVTMLSVLLLLLCAPW